MARRLFLDCDGVLADFDAGVRDLLGASAEDYQARRGKGAFWRALARADDFYGSLPLMADARTLFDAVAHLRPTILTGLPLGEWAAPQKRAWAERHFPGTPVITCLARDKARYMREGDVLVDDRDQHRHVWEAAGGLFILHKSARASLEKLARVFATVKVG